MSSSSYSFPSPCVLVRCCLAVALVLICSQNVVLGDPIRCEELGSSSCAFAVSSDGLRCVLEKEARVARRSGPESYTCRSSEIEAEPRIRNWLETDKCISDCGLERSTLGISSDALLDSRFLAKLCSNQCYKDCPNIADLYFNLAAGEGVFLPKLCEVHTKGVKDRREMVEISSSGITAVSLAAAPENSFIGSFAAAPEPVAAPSSF